MNRHFFLLAALSFAMISCDAQSGPVGGGCDGCELMYIDMPEQINHTDSSAGWGEKGQQLLVTGIVYQSDGKTPAPDVILYYWQTDNDGYYSPKSGMNEQAKRHGHIRGWVKTNVNGEYAIYTIRPAPYPGRDIPGHIHISIKEPGVKNEYYIDELVFDDDKLLTGNNRKALPNRGGSGILRVLLHGRLHIAEHNIILGLNIPGYPAAVKTTASSGLQIGEDSPSFTPYHAYGPDKGSRACPVCKYGRYHGILYFVGNNPNWEHIKKWLVFLEAESTKRKQYLKAYFVYGKEAGYNKQEREAALEKIGSELNLQNVALTFVPSLSDKESDVYLNKIDPEVESTLIIYRQGNIIDNFLNLQPGKESFQKISGRLDSTTSKYFVLPTPPH